MGRAPVATTNEDFYNVGTMRAELLENISPEAMLDTATINKYADIVNATSQMTYDMHIKNIRTNC